MGSIVSSLLGFAGASRQASAMESAARTSAAGQERAAQISAEEARFRPVGITTRFGRSMFQTGPEGRVTGAGYEVSPELRAFQDRLRGLTATGLTQAETAPGLFQPMISAAPGLFRLATGYLAETPQQAAQQYMARQQELVAPSREREFARIQNRLFQTGREGLRVGATSGTGIGGAAGLQATSPELEAYYNAITQEDARQAAQAQQAGMEQTRFGAGLFGTGAELLRGAYTGQIGALAPFEAYLGQERALETLGQQPLDIGAGIGARIGSPAGAQALLTGGMGAARTLEAAAQVNPFADLLINLANSPRLGASVDRTIQPYMNAISAMDTYGSGNVYGFGGRGVTPFAMPTDWSF